MTGIARFGVAVVAVAWLALACARSPPVDPAASPRISCVDVPQANCDEAVASVARSLPNEHPALISIVVRCTKNPCSVKTGEGDTLITCGDGTNLTGGWAYSSGS